MKTAMEKADLLKAMAHPTRLTILSELTRGVKCVGDLGDFLGARQSNVSQHLSLLRRCGLIDYYMDGRQRCYFIKHPAVPELLSTLGKKHKGTLPPPACCPTAGGNGRRKRA